MKTYEIYHYTYGDICSDTWFGKDSRCTTIGFVADTEDSVKALVEALNAERNSYYPKNEPEDEYDRDYDNADYIAYREVKLSSFEEIRDRTTRCW